MNVYMSGTFTTFCTECKVVGEVSNVMKALKKVQTPPESLLSDILKRSYCVNWVKLIEAPCIYGAVKKMQNETKNDIISS